MNTLNSASLVNKGLELIETHLLFGIDYDRIDVIVHPQSIVHSMVTFTDGSTLAQASPPDMKLPIALALGWPDRVAGCGRGMRLLHRLDLDVRTRGFGGVPGDRLGAPRRQGRWLHDGRLQRGERDRGRGVPRRHAPVPRIVRTVERVLASRREWAAPPATVDDVLAADGWARARARELVNTGGLRTRMVFAFGVVLFALGIARPSRCTRPGTCGPPRRSA